MFLSINDYWFLNGTLVMPRQTDTKPTTNNAFFGMQNSPFAFSYHGTTKYASPIVMFTIFSEILMGIVLLVHIIIDNFNLLWVL